VHELAAALRPAYEGVTGGLPDCVLIGVSGLGSWYVPRIFITVHGVKVSELPALAVRYGFAAAGPPEFSFLLEEPDG
jgi:hypothetical protein